ncbi:MAG: DNA mismatch repair protein MutS [Firmicutes bacterium HGW-Firmicutes-9]|jgi:DNA mismatch repair protein MutS|nr:MAG: DNA mismatch repair protein MutS [Firmicutes bacterium HGW-Firmicutes-9]
MPASMTPMMRQYLELKDKYSDCLLFFRLGDFYEMFFEDAKTAARELDLVLTGRDCGLSERAPMCGVPYHAVDNYISKLIEKGYKVAICEQVEDPALAKGLVERDVIRVITPGTVIEDRMLEEGQNNYIAAISIGDSVIGLAYADVSTGEFYLLQLSGKQPSVALLDELERIRPREIIAETSLFLQQLLSRQISSSYYLEQYGANAFLPESARDILKRHFNVSSLSGFGADEAPYAVSAAGALMRYLDETQKNALSHIQGMRLLNRSNYMVLDATTRRNLELTQPLRYGGNKKNTLIHLLDHAKTGMGGRMLRDWVDRPLQSIQQIERRLDALEELKENMTQRKQLQELLHGMYDIERLCSKIVYGSVNARDCVALIRTIERVPIIKESIRGSESEALSEISSSLDEMEDVLRLLLTAITEEPPATLKDGGFIRTGYNAEVDELRSIAENSQSWLENFEQTQREITKIKSLRVSYNRVFGYYIEVTKSYLAQVPYEYERKQTLANAERFITPELKEMEQKILGAKDRLVVLENELFAGIRDVLVNCTARLQTNGALIAELDCYVSLAEVASNNQYCRPKWNQQGRIKIINGRHPVIERAMKEPFVPNDVLLNRTDDRLLIITGPNMAGKSTYMRQTALIALMAHIGSFVPATEAELSIVDRIFTRIGASDDLSSGQSTFMVEMSEVANILHNASENSLLILDEIGRGTSTFDGLSIAWSVLEYIADAKKCGAKALFATHYHELTELEGELSGVKNFRVTVREIGEDIVFLRKIVRGGADQSFGIQVARLAGLPDMVLARAKEILEKLESADIAAKREPAKIETSVQPSLLDESGEESALRILREMDVNHLTPLDALNQLFALHAMLKHS